MVQHQKARASERCSAIKFTRSRFVLVNQQAIEDFRYEQRDQNAWIRTADA